MNAKDRNEVICGLISQYFLSKKQDIVWQREPSRSTLINQGILLGFLMAHDMDFEEDEKEIKVVKRDSKRAVVRFCKLDYETPEEQMNQTKN